MPEISRFYGIIIKMFFGDHQPPHFHVEYGSDFAIISITTLGVIAGSLPPRIMGMVAEWSALHQAELPEDRVRASIHEPLERIDPLP